MLARTNEAWQVANRNHWTLPRKVTVLFPKINDSYEGGREGGRGGGGRDKKYSAHTHRKWGSENFNSINSIFWNYYHCWLKISHFLLLSLCWVLLIKYLAGECLGWDWGLSSVFFSPDYTGLATMINDLACWNSRKALCPICWLILVISKAGGFWCAGHISINPS